MKKLLSLLVIGAVMLTGCTAGKDNKSAEKPKEAKEVKVVSTTVTGANVMDALGANLVGIPTSKSPLPERYKEVAEVGMAMEPDFEKIVALQPELVILDKNFEEATQPKVEQYKLKAFYLNTTTYAGFLESIKELGTVVNKVEEANQLVAQISDVEKEAKKKAEGKEAPTVAILFGAGENYMLATEASYLGDLVKTLGGKNITEGMKGTEAGYIPFSLEQLVSLNPDYVLRFAHGDLASTKKAFDEAFDANPAYAKLSAVKNGKVHDLDSMIFNVSANLQVKEAMNQLSTMLYGE